MPPDGLPDERVTVAELLRRAADPFNAKSQAAHRVLGNCGIRLIRPGEEARVLPGMAPGSGRARYFAVANRHAGLDRLHAGRQWAGGVWKQAARDLSGAVVAEKAKYGGAQSKGTAIPLALALGTEDEPAEAPDGLPLAADV